MERNIILVGFMGTGKSAVGKRLAKFLDFKFLDTDDLIEEMAGKTISKIFEENGEVYFRDLETEALKKLSHLERYVISAGGGAVLRDENIEIMKQAGRVICLSATPEAVYERVKNFTHRPLLQTPNPFERIKELLKLRKAQYEKADYCVDTSEITVIEVINHILKLMEKPEFWKK